MAELLDGEPRYRVDQVWHGLYQQAVDPDDMTDAAEGAAEPAGTTLLARAGVVTESVSDDGDTVKWLWALADGRQVETVLMHYAGPLDRVREHPGRLRDGVRVLRHRAGRLRPPPHRRARSSSRSCGPRAGRATDEPPAVERRVHGHGRAARQLRPHVGRRRAPPRRPRALGPPPHALDRRHRPGIRRLADEDLPVNLAVSLHAANDELRDELVPINRRYPLAVLADACRDYLEAKDRRLSFEWALIDGVNDRPTDAAELRRLRPAAAGPRQPDPAQPHAGLPDAGHAARPGRARSASRLRSLGVNATVRRNRGTDIDAACGQLRARPRDHAGVAARRHPLTPSVYRTSTVSRARRGSRRRRRSPRRDPAPATPRTARRGAVGSTRARSPITDAPPLAARLAPR